jgi:hypothetical protein
MWTAEDIAERLAAGLRAAEWMLSLEQAPLGLDSLDETALHPVLAAGFEDSPWAVVREQAYPGTFRAMPLPRDRERCDLVVLPEGKTRVLDPLEVVRDVMAREATLFAGVDECGKLSTDAARPEDAFWLEVKVVAQYAYVDSVPGPNRAYGSQLTRGPIVDVRKLSREAMVEAGGVGVVLFSADPAGVKHDFGIMVSKMLDRDLPISSPAMEIVEIGDRAGNVCAGVCVVPLRVVRGSLS